PVLVGNAEVHFQGMRLLKRGDHRFRRYHRSYADAADPDDTIERSDDPRLAQHGLLIRNVGVYGRNLGFRGFIVLPADTPDREQLFLSLEDLHLEFALGFQLLYQCFNVRIKQLHQRLPLSYMRTFPEGYVHYPP